MFTRAIVKRPCKNMINGITEAGLGSPDYDLACRQHDAYIQALETCGLSVTVLPPEEAYPDSVFIEDTCLVTPKCAVITRPGAQSRKGETQSVRQAMAAFDLPTEEIAAPGTLDAGDIMMVGDHYFVGRSARTNAEGFAQLETILNRYGMTASAVELESVLHLKTGISYLENNNLLAWGEFLTKEALSKFNILGVDNDEAYAANSVWVNGYVLVPAGHGRTMDMIEAAGYRPVEVDVSEFRKLDGGLSCLSLRF
ncbi:MAG: N(G),N(G)-dimethylarginine dimethylaminohydrolase [Desulfobacter sp.]|nr:MAG: N(G),N(G)-dimethylarginine dimethylaminohydrolase [Desulfobacter sp.]